MQVSPAKENILKRIRRALTATTPLPFPGSEGGSPLYAPPSEDLAVQFGESFSRLLGRFVYCAGMAELQQQFSALVATRDWKRFYYHAEEIRAIAPGFDPGPAHPELAEADLSITGCEALVARTGSMVLSSAQSSGRQTSVYAPVHICIATPEQLVYDIRDALVLLREKYPEGLPSMISFATGPSRTADIEKTLVVGVHGPREVYVFLLDNAPL